MAASDDKTRSFVATSTPTIRNVFQPVRVDKNDVTVSVRYSNRTTDPIQITRRDGVRFVIPPTSDMNPTDEFSVYVTYAGPKEVIKNTIDRLNESSPASGVERDKILRGLDRALYKTAKHATVVEATVEYMLTEQHLDQYGGRVYLTDLDTLVEWHESRKTEINHPFCQEEQDKKSMDAIFTNCAHNTFVMMIRAVDNTRMNQFSDRYVNIGSKVYRIPVESEPSLPTGIHITTRVPITEGSYHESKLTTTWVDFEKGDKLLHLHRTVENAENGGPITDVVKDILNEQAARTKLEEAKLRHKSLDNEEVLQKQRFEQSQVKSEQERSAHRQKMVLEWVKTGATLLTAGLGIYAAYRKISSS